MKILWFTNTPCGASEYLGLSQSSGGWLVSLEKLVGDDCELHIAFYHHQNISPFKINQTTYHPIYIHENIFQKIKKLWKKDFLNAKNIDAIKSIAIKLDPDIIHIHGTENDFLKILDFTTVPVIVSIQGIVSSVFHFFTSGFSKEILCTVKNKNLLYHIFGIGLFEKMMIDLKERMWIEEKYLGKVKYFFGRTDWDKSLTRVFAPNSHYFVLNEALRESFYTASIKQSYQTSNKIKLFSICSNAPNKGFDVILNSIIFLKKLNIPFDWVVAGMNNSDEIVNLSLKKFEYSKIPAELQLIGHCDESKLTSYLLDSDIFICPSYIENSPNSLSEAMMIGLPCVASNVGGIPSLIEHQKSGLLFNSGDHLMLVANILELIKNESMRREFGQNARKKALEFHEKSNIKQQLLTAYEFLISNEHGK